MKLIILILANDTDYYLQMQNLWKIYMNKHNNIKSYFIKYNNKIQTDVVLENDTIFIKGVETYIPGCLDKTIKSIEYIIKTNIEFDFIFRTNLSSVVNLNKFFNLLNYDLDCAGVVGYINNDRFISGAGMLISKKTCCNLIDNKSILDYYNIMDDVSIGNFLTINKINITPFTRFESYNYEDNIELITTDLISEHYHFRCKSDKTPINTLRLMEKIIELIYKVN